MTAYHHSAGPGPVRRTVIAALCLASLGFSALCLAAQPSQAEDAKAAAQPQAATPANAGAANPQAVAPAPVPSAAPAAAPSNDAAAVPQSGSQSASPAPAAAASPAPVPAAASEAAGKPEHESAPSVAARLLPHELSPWGMFMSADIVVKVVMVGLACASVITWTVWLAKSIDLFTARRRAQKQLAILASEETLATARASLTDAKGAVAQMVAAAAGELERSAMLTPEGIKERAAALIARIEARAGREMNRGTGALATIGATAPFIGLFGTVWGIMNSFIGISKTNTTNLAVVAPGIAEALLATAIGLVAAIPAVMILMSSPAASPPIGPCSATPRPKFCAICRAISTVPWSKRRKTKRIGASSACGNRRNDPMAVKLANSSDGDLDETHEINVTPFIDVILVLLIIFMVAAPLSTVDVNVDLPASTAKPSQRPDKPLFLTIKPDLSLKFGETPVSRDALAAALNAATGGDKDQRIFCAATRAWLTAR